MKFVAYHSALKLITSLKALFSRMVRWRLKLSDEIVSIEDRDIKGNPVADALSRNVQKCVHVLEVKVTVL